MFGWLERFNWWSTLSYPVKGAILRALKAALSAGVGVLLAAATAGTLFPAEASPFVILIVTAVLQSVDKFIREVSADNSVEGG